jgi:hypothetical protein
VSRSYRLGRRQASVDRTGQAILAAARQLVTEGGPGVSLGAVAQQAGVSRVTVYNRFGSRAALLQALVPTPLPAPSGAGDPRETVRQRLLSACAYWAADPALYRHLRANADEPGQASDRLLAERLAAADALRPGCSLKEAEDVIGALTSFAVFDRLYRDGRRTPAAVAEVLMRLASGILA